jgi:hypothetical protein
MDLSTFSDAPASSWYSQAADLLTKGASAATSVYNAVQGRPQTAAEVAAAAPVKPKTNWTPVIIIAAIAGVLGLGWLLTRK